MPANLFPVLTESLRIMGVEKRRPSAVTDEASMMGLPKKLPMIIPQTQDACQALEEGDYAR